MTEDRRVISEDWDREIHQIRDQIGEVQGKIGVYRDIIRHSANRTTEIDHELCEVFHKMYELNSQIIDELKEVITKYCRDKGPEH